MRNALDTVAVMGGETLDDAWWSTADVARFCDISAGTVRAYLASGRLPEPERRVGRTLLWRPETIRAWQAARPGQGSRTDLRRSEEPNL